MKSKKFKKTEIKKILKKPEKLISEINKFTPDDMKLNNSHSEDVSNLINGFNKLFEGGNKENFEIGKSFLYSSKENLDIAKWAYENKKYAQAIFNLSLATEKLVKSYGLIFMGVNYNDLKWKIGHKSPMTYVLMIKREPYKSCLNIMKSFYPDLLNKVSDQLKDFIENEKTSEEILNAKKEEINAVLDSYKRIEDFFNQETINKSNKLIKNVFDYFKIEDKIKKSFNYDLMPDLIISFTILGALSFILFPHYLTSNYPDQKIKYDENLGLVQCFNRIYEILIRCQESLNKYTI